jgi:diguanylate cyclase (GGDEF)-like protein
VDDNFLSPADDKDYISRLDAWTLQLYAVQHFDEAIKTFSTEVYEGLQCRSVIFLKYLKSFSSLIATFSEGVDFAEIRGQGLNFSNDKNFAPVKDFIRIKQNKTFVDMMAKISPNHDYETSLCVVKGEVKGLFVFTDISSSMLESSYYKVAERIFSHWASEILLLEQNHNLNRIDELTELLNKRVFSEYVALEVGRAQRIKHPVSFMVVRLDNLNHLKSSLNQDRYQSLLKMVAKIITQSTRKTDYVGVLSEGEFGVLFPHMSLKNSRNKSKQIKNILESSKYFEDSNLNVQTNFSICISEYPSLAHDFEDLHLSAIQKLMLEDNVSQIIEVVKNESFEPDFMYSEVEPKK